MRTYRPVRPKPSRQARMIHAAHLREQGLSTRQIANRQGVSHQTVMRDLAAWDAKQQNVVHLPGPKMPLQSSPGPASGATDGPPQADVIPLRRTS